MKIKYIKSGGFAGLMKKVEIDTTDISKDESEFFNTIIDTTDFFNYQTKDTEPMPDMEQIFISVEKGGKTHTVQLNALNIPEQFKPLIEKLRAKESFNK